MVTVCTFQTAAMLLTALTACVGSNDKVDDKPAAAKSSTKKVDCSDANLSQAQWMENCSDEQPAGGDTAGAEQGAGTGGDGKSNGLKFGASYTWLDGVKVTVVEAKVFKDFDSDAYETPDPKHTELPTPVQAAAP